MSRATSQAISISAGGGSFSKGVQTTCARSYLWHRGDGRQHSLKMDRGLMGRFQNRDEVIELFLQLGGPGGRGSFGLAPARGNHLLAVFAEPLTPLTSAPIRPQHTFAFGPRAISTALAISCSADSGRPNSGRGHFGGSRAEQGRVGDDWSNAEQRRWLGVKKTIVETAVEQIMLPARGFWDDSDRLAWLAQGNESWCRMQRRNRAKVDGLGLLLGQLKPALSTRKFVWGPTKSDACEIRIPQTRLTS